DPEEVKHLVDSAFERLVHDVVSFGGRVDKIVGDAIVALYGAPVAHEDDAERAVRAALRMQQSLAEFAAESGVEVRMRVGVNTGEVLVGALRAGGDYTAMGDVVNIASRLQTSADPGSVLVGEPTRLATEDAISYEPRGSLVVRGRDQPVEAYLALEPIARPGERPWSPRVPLVGRHSELALLGDALTSSIDHSRALVLLLSGDAGVGKSRLADELADRASGLNGARVFTGRFIPYGEANQWSAIAEVLREGLSLAENADEDEAHRAVLGSVEHLLDPVVDGSDVDAVVNGLLHLLGHDSPLRGIDPGRARVEATRALVSYMSATIRRGPIVVRLTDLHWADDSVLALLDEMVERLAGYPLVVLASTRRSLARRWSPRVGRHNLLVMNLDPLGSGEAELLLRRLTGEQALDAEVAAELLERSGGNPLFLEELVRFVRRQAEAEPGQEGAPGRLEGLAGLQALPELPDTLRGLLSARMDALTGPEVEVVEDAAVWGPTGPLMVLDEMGRARGADPEVVSATVRRLTEKEVLLLSGGDWRFRNDVLREVAYGRLTKTERLRRHRDVAGYLSALATTRDADDGLVEAVARHYTEAALLQRGLLERDQTGSELNDAALAWTEDAAARAEAGANWLLAERLFARAIEVLGDEDGERRLAYLLGRAGARLQRWAIEDAGEDLDRAEPLSDGHPVAEARVNLLRADLERRRGRFERAERLAEAARRVLEEVGATPELAEAHRMLAMIRLFSGAVANAEEPATRALELYQRLENPQGEAWATQHLAWISLMLGRIEEGERRIAASVRLFEMAGDRTGMMWSLGLEANLLFHNGFPEEAAEVAEVVLEEAELSDNPWAQGMMVSVLAQVDLWRGDTAGSIRGAERAVELLEPLGDPFGLTQARMLLGRALVMIGQVQPGLAELDRAMRENHNKQTNQYVARAVVESLLGDLSAGSARQLLKDRPDMLNIGVLEMVTAAALALICDGADDEARSELLVFAAIEQAGDVPVRPGEGHSTAAWRTGLEYLRSGQRRRRLANGLGPATGGPDGRPAPEATERLDEGARENQDDLRRISAQMERPPSWPLHLHARSWAVAEEALDAGDPESPFPPDSPLLDEAGRDVADAAAVPAELADTAELDAEPEQPSPDEAAELPDQTPDDGTSPPAEDPEVDLRGVVVELANVGGRYPAFGAMAALAEAVGDQPERAEVLANLVVASRWSTYHDRALAMLSAGVAAARTDRPVDAIAAVEEARALVAPTGDRLAEAIVGLGSAQIATSVGDDRAEAWVQSADVAWEELAVKPKGWRRLWRRVLP
ncbi:MAG: AAA family ATPase, partial [Microthrixaceae bacterium]|nr:AAA family ATPase [Microthrixaceae bacterium]